jgi:lipopolysaccharide assembly outer membrane protein LptD (OstA)
MNIIGHVKLPSCLLVFLVVSFLIPAHLLAEIPVLKQNVNATNSPGVSVEIKADRIEYDREREEYHAIGAVDVTRGPVRLTADEATLQKLTGLLTAVGHVHLRDEHADVWAEQLELNMNTEAGVLTTGKIFGLPIAMQKMEKFPHGGSHSMMWT